MNFMNPGTLAKCFFFFAARVEHLALLLALLWLGQKHKMNIWYIEAVYTENTKSLGHNPAITNGCVQCTAIIYG